MLQLVDKQISLKAEYFHVEQISSRRLVRKGEPITVRVPKPEVQQIDD